MGFLDKIFHRQTKVVTPGIRFFGAIPSEKLSEVENIVKEHYHGRDSEPQVVQKIKNATGLKAGHVSLEYNKRYNILSVYYCCYPP